MIVPDYWAEARVQRPRKRNQSAITVRRFGWSEVSQVEAERMAVHRAEEALQTIVGGKSLLRRSEPKMPYNGAEGVPIREEVLSRQDDVVITRNSYGAHCLNTPDVLFADIDFQIEPGLGYQLSHGIILTVLAILVHRWFHSGIVSVLLSFLVLFLTVPFAALTATWLKALRGGPEKQVRARLAAYVRRRPDWHLRVYRTPAGFRVLVMHRCFDPLEPAVGELFKALGVDPLYALMCKNQQCFRARVSPKPWRMGLSKHIRPRPGVWPVKAEHMELRNAWIRDYESAATRFASCKFLEALGSNFTAPKAAQVRDLHDRMSQALSGREIA